MNDTDSDEWYKKSDELEDLKKRLNISRQNAAKDIFERINSQGKNQYFTNFIPDKF